MKTSKQKLQKQLNDIQKQLDNLEVDKETKLEVGKWYREKGDGNFLICITNPFDSNDSGYGFGHYNCGWADSLGTWSFKPILATEKEVETALIKEAIKRGYKKGVTCVFGLDKIERDLLSNDFTYNEGRLSVKCYDEYESSDVIFRNGKWAKIIEDAKPKINGYEMEFNSGLVTFGCAKFTKNQFIILDLQIRQFNNSSISNRGIESFKLSSGVEITVGQLRKLVEYLKK